MPEPLNDPWLSARMEDRATILRAEAILHPAIRLAVNDFLNAAALAVLGIQPATASGYVATFTSDTDPPDLNAFPDDSLWTRLVGSRIVAATRRVFTTAYTRLTQGRPEDRAEDHSDGLAARLAAFPRNVFERLRTTVAESLARGERPADLRARVAALMTLEEWDGQVMTMTRTETMTALNAGAFAGAMDEQAHTGTRWEKRWQATRDQRVRHTHTEADGQVRALMAPFKVGGHRLQFPGDPLGPPEEVFNCRCSARYGPAGDPTLTAAMEEPR